MDIANEFATGCKARLETMPNTPCKIPLTIGNVYTVLYLGSNTILSLLLLMIQSVQVNTIQSTSSFYLQEQFNEH
jgi:hypothetical protein